jgi:hypothetical protein
MGRHQTLRPEPWTTQPDRGLADVASREGERCVSGRDTVAARAAWHAPRERRHQEADEDDEQQDRGHAPSLHAPVPAGKTPTGTC